MSLITEQVSCNLCGSGKWNVLRPAAYPEGLSRDALLKMYRSSSDSKLMDQLVECRDCSLVYLNPRVNESVVLESYRSAQDEVFVVQNAMRIRTFYRTWRKVLRLSGKYLPSGKRVLDIGCAGGAFLKSIQSLGFSGVGIEPSQWLVDFGRKEYGLDLRSGVLSEHAFPPGSFDWITLWDVLEHLSNPAEILTRCSKLLNEEGVLVVNYPDFESLARKLLKDRWPFFLSVHLYYFTPKTITKLLENAGFEVITFRSHWQTLELGYVLKRASQYVGAVDSLRRVSEFLGISKSALTYNVGQELVLARRRPCH